MIAVLLRSISENQLYDEGFYTQAERINEAAELIDFLSIIVANAIVQGDGTYAVPLDDIDNARKLLDELNGRVK